MTPAEEAHREHMAMRDLAAITRDRAMADKMRYRQALLLACGGDVVKVRQFLEAADGVAACCEWAESDPWGVEPGTYDSACGEKWSFTDGGVAENGVKFCHNCGKPVKVIQFPEPTDEDDASGVQVSAHSTKRNDTPTEPV